MDPVNVTPSAKAQEYQDQAQKLWKDAAALHERAKDRDETFTPEDEEQFDRMMSESDRLTKLADSSVRSQEVSAVMSQPTRELIEQADDHDSDVGKFVPESMKALEARRKVLRSEKYTDAFYAWVVTNDPRHMQPFQNVLTTTTAAPTIPEEYDLRILKLMQVGNPLRRLGELRSYSNDANVPMNVANGSAAWVDEAAAIGASDPTYSNLTFGAYKMGRLSTVTNETMADERANLEEDLLDSFATSFADLEHSDMVVTGAKTTPLLNNVRTPVATEATGVLSSEDLISVEYDLPEPYEQQNPSWLMSKGLTGVIRKIRNESGGAGTGDFMWQRSLVAGQPDTLSGYPVVFSKYLPLIVGTNAGVLYFGAFGGPGGYRIVDRTTATLARSEHYAFNTDGVVFRMTRRVDAKPTILGQALCQLDDFSV